MNSENKKSNQAICEELGITVNEMQGNVSLLKDGISAKQKADNKQIYQQRCGKAVNRFAVHYFNFVFH